MTVKKVLTGLAAGILASIVAIIVIIGFGVNTSAVVFGADKFTIWLVIFVVGITTAISAEVASGTSSKEVLFDAIVAAVVATVVINRDLSWLSYSAPMETGVHLFKSNLWTVGISALSSPAVKMGDKIMSHKFGKGE